MTFLRWTARTTAAFALAGFVAGGAHATWEIAPRTFVLEFQAGEPSSAGEKALAIAHSAAIEGLGFLCVGVFLALVAAGLARAAPRWRGAQGGRAAALVLAAGALFGWTELCWVAEDALAFLTRGEVLVLDAAAFLVFLGGLSALDGLVRRLPWAPRSAPATALASVLCSALGVWAAIAIVKGASGGWREPSRLALAAGVLACALPLAGLSARLLARPVELCGARLARGPLVPRSASLALWALLLACALATAPRFELSHLHSEPQYTTLHARGGTSGAPADGNPAGRDPSVVFVVIDTLRADHLGCYGYARDTSPFLDSIAAQGTRCADASAPAAWTKPSTGTLFTGLYPSRHGALYHGSLLHLPEGMKTLAEAFRERGYVTAGFVSNPNIKRVFAFDRGFDLFFDSPVEDTLTLACIRGTWFGSMLMRLLRHQFNWNYENDCASMNRHVLPWLEANREQPFFLYVHYIDPHIPYDPPAPYRRAFEQYHGFPLFNRRKELVGIDRYDGEIRYTDDALQDLVGALQRAGRWQDTLFVLTSDHGEEFFEHGVLGHGFSLFQEVVRVPLILYGPGVPAGRVVQEPVRILDLPATLLALAGAEVESFGDGKTFHRLIAGAAGETGEPCFLENEFGQDESDQRAFVLSGVRSGPWKLVLTEENAFFPPRDPRYGREALYHLELDPRERRNLFREEAGHEILPNLLGRLQTHSRFLQSEGFRDVAPAALTPDIEESLKALGYGD